MMMGASSSSLLDGPMKSQQQTHLFGKVTGDTVYNILRLAEVECDRDERPLNTHKIRSTEVVPSPFDDIIPREIKVKKEKNKEEGKKSQSKATNMQVMNQRERGSERTSHRN
ncbi:spliceosome-associated protein CWC27 homolog [Cyprinus carpio]|uniref:Spliceosome-associated protein CWC27 homolog n=1 Tax=Cyprinus carpio TaxID=7962 RepID=A0A9Q9Y1D0_CYPCA|nr:spliceosome-associated protein CWC27 homolog [Cyprinus carpio]